MADITKCTNTLCPLGKTCYRITAPDSKWQSYCNFESKVTVNGVVCDYYYNRGGINEKPRLTSWDII